MYPRKLHRTLVRFITRVQSKPLAEEEEFDEDEKKRQLRRLGRGIMSVRELVELYNKSDAKDRELLLPWLYSFVDYVKNGEDGCLNGGRFLEYADLANIRIHGVKEKEFLQSLVNNLSKRITDEGGFLVEHLSDALHDVLVRMDPRAFENRGQQLRQLVENLTAALSKQGDIPDHYLAMHRTPIYTIHQALFLLQKTPQYKLTRQIQVELYDSIEKCERIGIDKQFYPYYYQCRLVKQAILRLPVKAARPPWVQKLHTILHASWAGLHMMHILRNLCSIDCDPGEAEDVVAKFQEVAKRLKMLKVEEWYDTLQELHEAVVETAMGSEDVESVEKQFENVMQTRSKDVFFGAIRELSIAVLSDHDASKLASTCFDMLSEMLDLNSLTSSRQNFRDDVSFLEPVLNALCEICSRRRDHSEKAWLILEDLISCPEFESRNLLPDWAKVDTVKTRIKEVAKNLEDSQRNGLFYEVRSTLDWAVQDKDLTSVKNKLKNVYTRSDVSNVRSPSSHPRKMKIDDLKFAFTIRGAQHSDQTNILASDESQRSWFQQEMPNRTELDLADILTGNNIPGATLETGKPRKVLLMGGPCTGKSSFGRAIAHNWANGSFSRDLEMVYVLDLENSPGGESSHNASATQSSLEQVAAANILPEFSKHYQSRLEMVIDHDLDLETTLLVIDVATTGPVEDGWIDQAMQRSCNVLVLRNPITTWRCAEHFDVTLELTGLTDHQMIACIAHYFGENGQAARGLRYFLERCPDAWRMAHHPLALERLCHKWMDLEGMTQGGVSIPRSVLYEDVIEHIISKSPENFGRTRDERKRHLSDLESTVFHHELKNSPMNWIGRDQIDFPSNAAKDVTSSLLHPDKGDILKFRAYFRGKHITSTQAKTDKKEKGQVDAFIKDHMYESECMTSMCVAAEEIAKHDPAIMEHLLSLIEEKSIETIGLQPLLLKLSLLESFLSADEDRKITKIIKSVSPMIQSFIALLDLNPEEDSPLWKVLLRQLEQMPLVRQQFPKIDEKFKKRLKNGPYLSVKSFKSAARLFRGVSPYSTELVQDLKADYEKRGSSRRQRLILCVAYILKHTPDLGQEFISLIEKSLADINDTGVFAVALEHLDVFLSASPQDRDRLIPRLLKALESEEQRVAKTAWRQMSKCVELFRDEEKTSLLKIMETNAESKRFFMRIVLTEQIGCMFKAMPSKKASLVDLLRKGLNDKEEEVVMAALEQIPYFESSTLFGDENDNPLRKAFSKKKHRISKFVMRQLKRFVRAARSNEELCVELLKEGVHDSNKTVQEAALDEIANLCLVLPHRRDELFDLWKTAADQQTTMSAGVKQIGAMIGLMPEKEEVMRELLEKGIDHKDKDVQQQAMRQIPAFVGVAKEKLPRMLLALNNGLDDKSVIVREAAHETLHQMPLTGLFELAWANRNNPDPDLAKEIGYRLLDAAVTVTSLPDDSGNDSLKVTVYPWSGKVEWEQPSSGVKNFAKAIVQSLNDEYPGLYQMPNICR